MGSAAFTNEDLAQLDELLEPLAGSSNTMRADEVQAFFLALITGPDKVDSDIWWREVLGESLPLKDKQDEALLRALLEKLYATTASLLVSGNKVELFLFQDEQGNDDYWAWCNAYLYALEIVPTDWYASRDEVLEDLMYPIFALGGLFDEKVNGQTILSFTHDELNQMRKELPTAIIAIYHYWLGKKPRHRLTLH